MFNPWLFLIGLFLVAQSTFAAFPGPSGQTICATCNGASDRMTQAQPNLPVIHDVSQILNYPQSGLVQVPTYSGSYYDMALPGAYSMITPSFQFNPEALTWSQPERRWF